MMLLVLFVCVSAVISVEAEVIIKDKVKLIKAGDPVVLECNELPANWEIKTHILDSYMGDYEFKTVANCTNCPSSTCESYDERFTASCSRETSELHIKSAQIGDHYVTCPEYGSVVYLQVGIYDAAHLYSEDKNPFALDKTNYTLVCDFGQYGSMYWFNEQAELLMMFTPECDVLYSEYNTTKFDITCNKEQKKVKLRIKYVSIKEDGTMFGCCRGGELYLFKLTVNVPVTSVSIQPQTQVLIENKNGTFICEVEESKPEASFQWSILYKNGSSEEIKGGSTISKIPIGRCWQTNSTLTLKLKRDYQKIMCKATIGNLPWKSSEYQDIKYPPEITMNHSVTQLEQNAVISCDAHASPDIIQYKLVQNWGRKERRLLSVKKQNFESFSYNDLGEWICMASNGVPTQDHYTNKSVEIKVNVAAHFKGGKNQTALVGSNKHLKICFYCYPEATEIKWYKGDAEMSTSRVSPYPADDGIFPFTGNCSILTLDITEKEIQMYRLQVTNLVGQSIFEVMLYSWIPDKSPNNNIIITACVIAVISIIIIGVCVFGKCQRSSQRKIKATNLTHELQSSHINETNTTTRTGHLEDEDSMTRIKML